MTSLKGCVETRRIAPDGTAATTYSLAAGTSDVFSEIVDVEANSLNSAMFTIVLGAIDATGTIQILVQQGDDPALADAATIAGTTVDVTASDDHKLILIDVRNPTDRYIRLSINRGTANSAITAILVDRYASGAALPAYGATVVSAEAHSTPAEGVA